MDGPAAILVAIISSTGFVLAAIAGAVVQTRRIGQRGGGSLAAEWRSNFEAAQARAELMEEQRNDERLARRALEQELRSTQVDLDTCARQLDDERSTNRALRRDQVADA